jgi:hypothetical protein
MCGSLSVWSNDSAYYVIWIVPLGSREDTLLVFRFHSEELSHNFCDWYLEDVFCP